MNIPLQSITSYLGRTFFPWSEGKKNWTRTKNNLTCCKIQGRNRHVQKVYRQVHSFAKIMRVSYVLTYLLYFFGSGFCMILHLFGG